MADSSPSERLKATHRDSPLLEVCVDSVSGFLAAVQGGADRIELCSSLSDGGLTPSVGFMKFATRFGSLTRAMIRPRAGDFTYSSDELDVMRHDIDFANACGLAGVVLGANRITGELDEASLARLVGHAKSLKLKVALHRGFDLTPDLLSALEIAIDLKVDTVLTSGGEETALAGADKLSDLVCAARGRIEILAGRGITAENASQICSLSGVTAIHASCRRATPFIKSRAAELGYVLASQTETHAGMVSELRNTLNGLDMMTGGRGLT